jgi:aminopeptidase
MYIPDPIILKRYADVLVKFALWNGNGVRKGDVVCIQLEESAKPFLDPLQIAVLEAGAHPMLQYMPEGVTRSFFEHATDEQVNFVPKEYLLARVHNCDHFLAVMSTNDKYELKGVDSKKIMSRGEAMKFYIEARTQKETAGKFTWTLALYGTEAMAKEVGMTVEEYWDQIIQACFLDKEDPIKEWRAIFTQIEKVKNWLNSLQIESVHVEGNDVDLHLKLGKDRKWLGGSGRNIPSFEVFISPDWRGTNGTIAFNQPLYRYGNIAKDIKLTFKNGEVTDVKASENEQLIKDMIAVPNANKVGEFSLTDKKFSRITKFMGETLFDENVGGEFGNTHIAVGKAYKDSYSGDGSKLSPDDWEKMGYNESSVHTDMVSTTDRTVTATLADGSSKVIYKNGEFQI